MSEHSADYITDQPGVYVKVNSHIIFHHMLNLHFCNNWAQLTHNMSKREKKKQIANILTKTIWSEQSNAYKGPSDSWDYTFNLDVGL